MKIQDAIIFHEPYRVITHFTDKVEFVDILRIRKCNQVYRLKIYTTWCENDYITT